jgi:hypothetical protein
MMQAFVTASLLFVTACAAEERSDPPAVAERSPSSRLRAIALPEVDHVGAMAREPMIVQAPDGTLFLAGYGEDTPTLWRSSSAGESWERVNVGTAASGAVGNSDVDLAVGPDGTLYFIAMTYDRVKNEGVGIAVGSSRDNGASWTWKSLSRDRYDDRPWIEVAPDGTAHAIWNDGAGVSHAVSSDRGATWTERARVSAKGGSSHLAISPAGTIAVRITPISASANRFDSGVDSLAVSTDGGYKWAMRGLPGKRAWSAYDENAPMLRWVEPIAWDSVGALFSLWSEGNSLWIGRSGDEGVTWRKRPVLRPSQQDSTVVYFPYLTARGQGALGLTWFSGLGHEVRANVAYAEFDTSIVNEETHDQGMPAAYEVFAFPSYSRGDTSASPTRDTAGEYIPVIFLTDGRMATVTTIQEKARKRYGFTFRPYRLGQAPKN